MTSAEIFQAMRLADMGKVREKLDRYEKIAKREPRVSAFMTDLFNLFNDAKREVPRT